MKSAYLKLAVVLAVLALVIDLGMKVTHEGCHTRDEINMASLLGIIIGMTIAQAPNILKWIKLGS